MNEFTIKEQYREIISLLDDRQIVEAFYRIQSFISDITDWELRSSIEETQTAYQYMLKYMMQGIEDPERTKLYHRLVSKLYSLTDRSRIMLNAQISTEYYYDRLRYFNRVPKLSYAEYHLRLESYAEDLALKKLIDANSEINDLRRYNEQTITELFYCIWVSEQWTEDEEKEMKELLKSPLISINDLSLIISAVTLGLTECFDIRKFMFLFDAYEHPSNEINQRAIIGLATIISLFDRRLSLYPDIDSRIKLLSEHSKFADNLLTIQIQFLRSRETEKIDRKMREEIIPEMMKNMDRMNKIDLEGLDEENLSDDLNPDWENWTEKSGLQDKMKEMSELQMEGADVYMSTFSQLKRYPFFSEMANWFRSFDMQHSSVTQIFGTDSAMKESLLTSLLQSGFFCNSDKYSFCFTIMQVPEAQRTMMLQQLEDQNNAINEDQRTRLKTFSQRPENISNQYIHDLYRFYKLYSGRTEFLNPFFEGIELYACDTLKEITRQTSFIRPQADFLFQKEYYSEANSLYHGIAERTEGDVEIYQRMGYCMQKRKKYEQAIKAYLHADLQKPDNLWTNRHLSICYRLNGQYDKALEYYKKVETVQPENLRVVTQIGLCLSELKRYDEALSYFFKVEYLNGSSAKIWRAIGWCSFAISKYEQAAKYYDKLTVKGDAQSQDFLNAGHVSWVQGNIKKAMELYTTSLQMHPGDDEFLLLFDEDEEILLSKGIKKEDIPLMIDLVFLNSRNSL